MSLRTSLTELGEMCDAIGIIEQGKLITRDRLADIQSELRPHIDVVLRLIGSGERLGTWLADRPNVSHIQASDRVVRFQLAGETEQRQASLLKEIVDAEFPVTEYTTERRSLEDVFLHITNGIVQ